MLEISQANVGIYSKASTYVDHIRDQKSHFV